MAKVSISEAARLTGKPRSTLHRHIKKGKVTKETDGQGNPVIDVAELERVYGKLQQAGMEQNEATIQPAPPKTVSTDREELAVLRRENTLLREHLEEIKKDRDHWRAQSNLLLADLRTEKEKKEEEEKQKNWRVRLSRWIAGNKV